jgi:TonB family protein
MENPPEWTSWAADLHAGYFFDRDEHKEFLEIYPLGYKGPPSSRTRFELPLSGAMRCREELAERCVISLTAMSFPSEAANQKAEGSILLGGKITEAGQVTGIQVLDNSVPDEKQKSLLATAAVQNLAFWRMAPAPREDSIRITYSFLVDSVPSRASTDVKWELPDKVVIVGHRGTAR